MEKLFVKIICYAFTLLCFNAWAEIKTITDVLGREVKVDVPVKRAILTFYYPDYIAVTGADNFQHVVGISREFWEKFNPGSWALFVEKLPNLKTMSDVGNVNTNTFSTEKALALNPDVLILADWQYQALESEVPRFTNAGIPVIVVDFNAQTVARHTQSAKIFGQLAGTEARTEKITQEYADGIADIQRRVQTAHLPKPKIYVEFGNKGPEEYSFTFGKNMWGAIAEMVGGDNISAPHIQTWGAITPEQLLVARPDVIMISGTELEHDKNPRVMSMGIGINEDDARTRLAGFTQRTGWDALPAVQNHRVYGLYHTASRSLADLAAAQFMAKALYPEQFSDVDPEKTYLDFHRHYLPIYPTGIFFLYPNK
ncbi:MAG: ABC transporter substrate-binding protein [Cardiobacteriaceae bacterium]|nr:ABC transporter substrate-binding protein [Cardiobacteriaceae bacterium]